MRLAVRNTRAVARVEAAAGCSAISAVLPLHAVPVLLPALSAGPIPAVSSALSAGPVPAVSALSAEPVPAVSALSAEPVLLNDSISY